MSERGYDQSWHLDRKVPIALILAIVMQTAGIIWFAAGIYHRVETLEKEAMSGRPNAERITRVEVKIENVQEGILRIERLLQPK